MNIQLTETETPLGGAEIYKPEFRTMELADIEALVQEDLKSYESAGYNSFTFHRATANISIRKIELKTLGDCFMTDIYKLLDK